MKFAHLASMTTVAFLLASAAPSIADVTTDVTLQSGHSVVLEEDGLKRVAVGDGQIAGVLPVGNHQLVINGKNAGRTTLFVWTNHGRETYEVTVNAQGSFTFADMLRAAIPFPDIQVAGIGQVAIVRGFVDNNEQMTNLKKMLVQFNGAELGSSSGKSGKVQIINAVTVRHPLGGLQGDLAKIPGVTNLRVDADDAGNLIVSGQVDNRVDAERILGHVRGLAAPYLGVDSKVMDRLEVAENTEIDIKVQVLEVDRTAQNTLGVSLGTQTFDPTAGTYTYSSTPQYQFIEGGPAATAGKALSASGSFFRYTFLGPTLNALITHGDAKNLAEPHLTTLPGEQASFLVGGQIPYLVSSGLGQETVQFQPYGVNLQVTPIILPNGSIQTKITPDISSIDNADGVQLNGSLFPALKESKITTTVISRPGQSIVLGGLVQHVESKQVQEFPILGQLPILGKLFRSTAYQDNKTDVVFVMTPEIINR